MCAWYSTLLTWFSPSRHAGRLFSCVRGFLKGDTGIPPISSSLLHLFSCETAVHLLQVPHIQLSHFNVSLTKSNTLFSISKQDKLVIMMTKHKQEYSWGVVQFVCLSMNYTYHICSTFMWKLWSFFLKKVTTLYRLGLQLSNIFRIKYSTDHPIN